MNPQNISIKDYDYSLPLEKIAMYPLAQRDASKLLIYENGTIKERLFSDIANHLPSKTLLVMNNTRVINARIKFTKNTGAAIEIFCLEPTGHTEDYNFVMMSQSPVQWKCFVGGAAKWQDEILEKVITIGDREIILKARRIEKNTDHFIIEFSWEPASYSLAEIIEAAGNVPLPPYIKRLAEDADTTRYQTIFAQHPGSVAAPTAGLHFSKNILQKLAEKGMHPSYVTLHVGAGTFKPVKAETMSSHEMHAEYIDVSAEAISQLKNNIGNIAAVGTTSLRTIESLYWFGVKVYHDKHLQSLSLQQWEVYEEKYAVASVSAHDALTALEIWMENNNLKNIFTQTQILIAPGYKFRIADMLITNFHQPKSTLLLLVAAAIGDDWKKMYEYALANNFRFLSYGDANLIFFK